MRNVILQEFVTLDGLAAGPNDSVDFVPSSTRGDRSFGQPQFDFLDSIDAILLGRVTYKMFADPGGEAWDAYVWIEDADALREEYRSKGVTVTREVCDQPFGQDIAT